MVLNSLLNSQTGFEHLSILKGDTGGFAVDRFTHCLQTATRAYRDGRDEEYVVCALLHDIGDTIASANHADLAATMLEPFVSEENYWIVKHHGIFQGYYFFEYLGLDKNMRDEYKDSPYWHACAEFCAKYDQNSFDPDYDNMALEDFEPMVRKVFARPKNSIYKKEITLKKSILPMDRIESLISELTLEEKVSNSLWIFCMAHNSCSKTQYSESEDDRWSYRSKRRPVSGATAACFPSASCLSSTWDKESVQNIGKAIGIEAKSKDADVLLGPTINLHRHPLGGRHFECYSEDPILTGELAVSYVTGVQSVGVSACLKHFIGNDTEFQRHFVKQH